MEGENELRESMLDAGCTAQAAESAERLYKAGRLSDALHEMKVIRCELMEELHQSQRQVDHLDRLIRQTEREIRMTAERRQRS